MLGLRQKIEDISNVSFTVAFIQCINHYHQFRHWWGNLPNFGQGLKDELLKLVFHQLSGDVIVRIDCFPDERYNRGHPAEELGSDGGEEPRGITTLTLTSLEEEASPELTLSGENLSDGSRYCRLSRASHAT
jgi:hypothetical protein